MYFVRGQFLGIKERLQKFADGNSKVFVEAGVGVERNDGFGGQQITTVFLRVPKAIQDDQARLAKFHAAKGKRCNIEFIEMTREGKNGKTYYDRYLQGEPEILK